MTSHITDKLRRAMLIHLELIELEKLFGRTAPSPYAWLQPTLRLGKGDGPWYARILDNSFIANARKTKAMVGESILEAPGWTAFEIFISGRCRLAFSIREGVIILHRCEPGLWENWFGVCRDASLRPYP